MLPPGGTNPDAEPGVGATTCVFSSTTTGVGCSVDVTDARLVNVPVKLALVVTTNCTCALAPPLIVPSAQVRTPLAGGPHVPCDGVADTNVVPLGSVSASVTPCAAALPVFEIVTV
jgi:hypothetical protein